MRRRLATLTVAVFMVLAPVPLVTPAAFAAETTGCSIGSGNPDCNDGDCNWLCKLGKILGAIAVELTE